MQLSNISQACIKEDEKESYSGLAILVLIVGIIICFVPNIAFIGVAIVLISLCVLSIPFAKNRKKKYLLKLCTNSGLRVVFECKDEEFLVKVMNIIKDCIDGNKNYEINLEKCIITNSQIGQKNVMNQNIEGEVNASK